MSNLRLVTTERFGEIDCNFKNISIDELNLYEKEQKSKIDYIPDSYYRQKKYGFVYAIVTKKYFKIGISADLNRRIRNIKQILIEDEIR